MQREFFDIDNQYSTKCIKINIENSIKLYINIIFKKTYQSNIINLKIEVNINLLN